MNPQEWIQLLGQSGVAVSALVALAWFYNARQKKEDERNVKRDVRLELVEDYVRNDLRLLIVESNKCINNSTQAIEDNTEVIRQVKERLK